jgi:hypothetical protein
MAMLCGVHPTENLVQVFLFRRQRIDLPEHILLIGANLLNDILPRVPRQMPVMEPLDRRFQPERYQQADGDP